ncbi:unnamed protein product [Mesocestoides corti]|uniref:Replication factor C subunit 1 n=1 Tax=Mesocestoides corti TaxID=53468 RepID=A0A3P6I987_MESCO|nr:unnamed protein product [Mesocestoides corti]
MEPETIPKKRAPRVPKRKIPTFEEGVFTFPKITPFIGVAGEEIQSERSEKPASKRRRSVFPADLGDPDEGPRGKIQLTFEESLKIAESKKISEPIKPKTLHHYFSASQSSSNVQAQQQKKEIAVDDFFASSKPHKVRRSDEEKAASSVAVEGDDDICLSASSVEKPLVPSPENLRRQSRKKEHLPRPSTSPTKPAASSNKVFASPTSPTSPKESVHRVKERDAISHTTPPSARKKASAASTPDHATPKTPGGSRAAFWAFQARDGPRALGSRPIPKNASNCFDGKTFVITGVLECLDRDDAQALIERGGGRVTKSVSKKTTYLVVGRESGASKLDKATALGTKQLTEDEFFDLVYRGFGEPASEDDDGFLSESVTVSREELIGNTKSPRVANKPAPPTPPPPPPSSLLTDRPLLVPRPSKEGGMKLEGGDGGGGTDSGGSHELWVEKYRPTTRKQLVGQSGATSPANRLFAWLSSWQEDFAAGHKVKAYSSAPPWAAGSTSDSGAWARAALLSGPPGIGKTTTATVVCRELGLSTIEMNASDTRSKRSLQEEVAEALGMRSLANMLTGKVDAPALTSHVLIMDEVDGMAGNEDRGGMQELIGIIKTSKVPVICLCNDRQSAKVRSLANYCLDLRFHRPRVEQIKAAILSMVCREGVSVGPTALNEIITASNQDLRQVINSVQMWCMGDATSIRESDVSAGAAAAHKNLRLGPFEVIRKVFHPETDGKTASFAESMDLFFQDYSIGPLFVQENYVNVRPLAANGNLFRTLDLLAKASEDIATGDIVGRTIQSTGAGAWSLLPVQAVFSCLRPGRFLRGPLPGGPGGVSFPSWFGKNSTQGKNSRILSELSRHMRLSTHGGATDPRCLLMDYLGPLAVRLSAPLKEGDVNTVIETLDAYKLLREDMDNIMDLTSWQGRSSLMKAIDSKACCPVLLAYWALHLLHNVKAALTRSYNKSVHILPYATSSGTSGKRKARATEGTLEDDEAKQLLGEDSESASGDEDPEILKVSKKPSKKSTTASSSSNGKADDGGPKSQRGSKGKRKKKDAE